MKLISCVVILTVALTALSGCAQQNGLTAPCDPYAKSCGQKTKINQW